jgi:hypothetical protein
MAWSLAFLDEPLPSSASWEGLKTGTRVRGCAYQYLQQAFDRDHVLDSELGPVSIQIGVSVTRISSGAKRRNILPGSGCLAYTPKPGKLEPAITNAESQVGFISLIEQ